jgi:hypothetical protein
LHQFGGAEIAAEVIATGALRRSGMRPFDADAQSAGSFMERDLPGLSLFLRPRLCWLARLRRILLKLQE